LVTISGTNLAGATAVHFGKVLAKIKSTADTQIVVTSPAGKSGPVDVTVTTPGGTSVPSALYQFTYAATAKAPAIIASRAITPDVNDLALLALAGQSSPSATLQRKTVDNLMASLLM
ncbi:MAG: IPT/TIG domain-containing protein, partial [Thermoguttaceae bacterium]